jgi:hypothetical protein
MRSQYKRLDDVTLETLVVQGSRVLDNLGQCGAEPGDGRPAVRRQQPTDCANDQQARIPGPERRRSELTDNRDHPGKINCRARLNRTITIRAQGTISGVFRTGRRSYTLAHT